MITEPIRYAYALNVKLSLLSGQVDLHALFPSVDDVVLTSREFDQLEDALRSANQLTGSITSHLSLPTRPLMVVSEVNPRFSQKETLSTDWAPNEVVKLWVVDKRSYEERATLNAVGLTQLMEVAGPAVPLN